MKSLPPAGGRPAWLNRPLSRAGCLAGCGLWLLAMSLPLLAVFLAANGEVAWRRGDFVEDRLWLVNAPGGAERGLAYSSARSLPGLAGPESLCVRTRVHFWLWQGQSQAVDYCDCYAPAPEGGYTPLGNCP